MSLINQMLKDLEKRRSRDLETSPSLNENISWESVPNNKSINWLSYFVGFTLILLLMIIGYLLWERTTQDSVKLDTKKTKIAVVEKQKTIIYKPLVKKQVTKKKAEKEIIVKNTISNAVDIEDSEIDTDEIDTSAVIKLKKTQRPLNNKQLAEIAYKKGYRFLQQGRMHQGKESLRKALSLYIPHIKAREMLAGIYIKSGRFINAAELLSEGVKLVPEYSLFAQLYARVLLEQKKPYLALKILEQGTARIKANPDYFALLAATYQRVNAHEKAIDLYLQLVKIRPNEGVWWLGLGISLEKAGKSKEALEAYQRAQKTGSLKAGLIKFTNNRVSALQEIGFPEGE